MMAEKIAIEIFRKKPPEELTTALSEPDSRTDVGSGTALTASVAAAFLHRAASIVSESEPDQERVEYIRRNADTLRMYMVHLIDEDVKSRGPLRRAVKENDSLAAEAARQPAVAICGEIVNMMTHCLDLLCELADHSSKEAERFILSSAELAMGAIRASMRYIVDMGTRSSDETYRYIIRRENEITLEQYSAVYAQILEKLNK